jgi:hypothetical protein
MSSECPGIIIHVSTCITGLLETISIPVITSGINSGGLGFHSHWEKEVVGLLSKNIGGNDATSFVF